MKIKLLLCSVFAINVVNAQVKDTTTTHIVKSGENLNSITRLYLGTDFLWAENWKLNPEIKNPNLLKIGQKLTVIKERIIPAETATMREIINNVEKKLTVGDWHQAKSGDQLEQKEGLRTLKGSSTLLEFNETSSLKILEYSQVFLKSRKTSLRGTDSSTIEIIEGDTELKWEPLNVKSSEIEIISGSTKLVPENNNGTVTALRTGIADNGNSVISVYEGNSNVESGGANVSVKKGMGISVKQGEKPPKPKPLLKSPKIDFELTKMTINYTNPILQWNQVSNSKQYLVEICADQKCNKVINQIKTENTQNQINNIDEAGIYYWRVAAISEDDLVGFKSKTNILDVTKDKADIDGPSIVIKVIGKQKVEDKNFIIAPSSVLKVYSIDHQSGFNKLYYSWNNDTLVFVNNENSLINLEPGILTLQATDKLGNESIRSYHFSYEE